MRWLWLVCLSALAWGQSHEILRPTTDVDGGSAVNNAVLSQCQFALLGGSISQPNWYDSGGLSTSSTFDFTNTSGANKCASRVFKTWQSTGNTYTALTLNINTSGACGVSGTDCGTGQIAYSLNSGSTWTTIAAQGGTVWSQQTSTITLSANQTLSTIWVASVWLANAKDIDRGDMSISGFDIWTDGTYTPATPTPTPVPPNPSVPQPSIISKLTQWLWWLL